MVTVILVRHGETEWNKTRRLQGCGSNTGLNQRGKQHAESLALRLKSERIQAIYSSPLKRAMDTARAIAHYHRLTVDVEPALREMDIGELEGISVSQTGNLIDQYTTALLQGNKMPGGESLPEVQQRVWSTIQRLANQHSGGGIVVVTHFFPILTIICSVLDLPLSQIGRLKLVPGSITILSFEEKVQRLALFNETYHLTSN